MKSIKLKLIKVIKWSFLILLLVTLILFAYFSFEIIEARASNSQTINQALNKESIPLKLSDFDENRISILLKVEDPNFYHHKGIDTKTPGAGWTTITQGLVKIYYFNRNFKPGFLRFNKIRQTLIARFVYHSKITKEDQLRLFINNVYFGSFNGNSILGFAEAAKIYFNKDFKDLDENEFISLVATLVAPNNNNPNKTENAERVRRIKRLISGECQAIDFKDVFLDGCK